MSKGKRWAQLRPAAPRRSVVMLSMLRADPRHDMKETDSGLV
jgi:hypothetical protein